MTDDPHENDEWEELSKIIDDMENTILAGDLEYKLQIAAHIHCECASYLLVHHDRLFKTMLRSAALNQEEIDQTISRFVQGMHKRHLEGKSLFA